MSDLSKAHCFPWSQRHEAQNLTGSSRLRCTPACLARSGLVQKVHSAAAGGLYSTTDSGHPKPARLNPGGLKVGFPRMRRPSSENARAPAGLNFPSVLLRPPHPKVPRGSFTAAVHAAILSSLPRRLSGVRGFGPLGLQEVCGAHTYFVLSQGLSYLRPAERRQQLS